MQYYRTSQKLGPTITATISKSHEPKPRVNLECDFGARTFRSRNALRRLLAQVESPMLSFTWVVVKIMVPFWVLVIIRHLLFRVPKSELNFDNHPHAGQFGLRV